MDNKNYKNSLPIILDHCGQPLTNGFYVDRKSFSHYYSTGQIFAEKFAVFVDSDGRNHRFSDSTIKNFQKITRLQEYAEELRKDADWIKATLKNSNANQLPLPFIEKKEDESWLNQG